MHSIAQGYRAHSIMPNNPSRRTLSIESEDSKIVIAVVLYGGGGGEGERVMGKDGLVEVEGRGGRGSDGRADGERGSTKVGWGNMDSGEVGVHPYFHPSYP